MYLYTTYGRLSKTDTHFVKHESKEARAKKVLSIQFAKKFSCNNYFWPLAYYTIYGHQETQGSLVETTTFCSLIFFARSLVQKHSGCVRLNVMVILLGTST